MDKIFSVLFFKKGLLAFLPKEKGEDITVLPFLLGDEAHPLT
jgi:hypothetical protein